jgi:hypothetical protein
MNRLLIAVCCVIAVCCAGVVGVAGVSAAQADKAVKDIKSTIMTGCVVEKDGRFSLDHAMKPSEIKDDMKADMKHDDMTAKALSYDLMGGTLKPHVGHRIEVTGIMDSRAMGTDKMATDKMATDKMAGKDRISMAEVAGTINVTSVKMLSATCP